jgi:hypothetical protein
MSDLLEELREEKFGQPDDEHTQVSIGNKHWAVSAQVSGLITFDNMDFLEGAPSDFPESMYLRDVPDDVLKAIWRAVIGNDKQALMGLPWSDLDAVARYEKDYYRASSAARGS